VNAASRQFALGKLEHALQCVHAGACLHESLYKAYLEDLQWLEELEDLPSGIQQLLRELRGPGGANVIETRARRVGRRLSEMPAPKVRSLATRLAGLREEMRQAARRTR
jgi:hypothetical protein